MKKIPAILIEDTREQLVYGLEGYTSKYIDFSVLRQALPAGDYAAYLPGDEDSLENICVVERKSHADLLGTLAGPGRERFERELERLRLYGFKSIVCETDIPAIIYDTTRRGSKVNPRAIIASLIAFAQRFNTHIIFASDRSYGELYTFRILERWVRDRAEARVEHPELAGVA